MKSFVVNLLVASVSIFLLSYLLPGVTVAGFLAAMITALVLGLVNAFIRPLFLFLTLPITLLTMGIFLLFVNAIMIMLADYFVGGFKVDTFWWALLFSFLLSMVSTWIGSFVGEKVKR